MGQQTLKKLRKAFTNKQGVVSPRFKEIKKKFDDLPAPERGEFLKKTIDLVRSFEDNMSKVT